MDKKGLQVKTRKKPTCKDTTKKMGAAKKTGPKKAPEREMNKAVKKNF
ncbi:MAG: hypothetical protein QGF13_04370 [Alphaproteobacteria bacterium]|jgi:hypothetical protein|nr:hypothetical protein [Alphaproteobacteria bacterium]|tara:strand:+ start:2034 stop:2177 length:144 start_codon:yes stop_codon:yes gene_type:complete